MQSIWQQSDYKCKAEEGVNNGWSSKVATGGLKVP